MKKTNIFAAVASLALLAGMFTGCVTDNPDLEAVGNLDGYYIRGELYEDGWNIKDDSNKLVADTEKGSVGFYYAKFKALGESGQWKIANGDWTSQFNQKAGNMTIGTLPEGVKNEQVDDGNGGLNEKLVGLKTGQWYKINVIATATAVEVSLEESEGTAEAVPVPYYLDGMYLVGGVFNVDGTSADTWSFSSANLIWGATVDKKTGIVTYSKDVKAVAATGEMGINDSNWKNSLNGKGVTVTVGATEATALDGEAGNFNVEGLTVGSSYRVQITTTPDKEVAVKIFELLKANVKVVVKGISDVGQTAIISGEFNSWSGWTTAWGGEKKVSQLVNAEVDETGKAEFNLFADGISVAAGDNISYGACGYWGEVVDDDIATASGEIKINNANGKPDNFKIEFTVDTAGTWVTTVDLTAGTCVTVKQ